MIDLASIPLAYRLLIAGGVMIGPTLLFLGLCRFLEWLRDDALLERMAEREGVGDADGLAPTFGDVLPGEAGSSAFGSGSGSVIRCPHCGAPTLADASACLECGESPT
ncbi:zinc ribbon domain-containing protein [Halopiger thermotolerans]